jgi:hypothetical protein
VNSLLALNHGRTGQGVWATQRAIESMRGSIDRALDKIRKRFQGPLVPLVEIVESMLQTRVSGRIRQLSKLTIVLTFTSLFPFFVYRRLNAHELGTSSTG